MASPYHGRPSPLAETHYAHLLKRFNRNLYALRTRRNSRVASRAGIYNLYLFIYCQKEGTAQAEHQGWEQAIRPKQQKALRTLSRKLMRNPPPALPREAPQIRYKRRVFTLVYGYEQFLLDAVITPGYSNRMSRIEAFGGPG